MDIISHIGFDRVTSRKIIIDWVLLWGRAYSSMLFVKKLWHPCWVCNCLISFLTTDRCYIYSRMKLSLFACNVYHFWVVLIPKAYARCTYLLWYNGVLRVFSVSPCVTNPKWCRAVDQLVRRLQTQGLRRLVTAPYVMWLDAKGDA